MIAELIGICLLVFYFFAGFFTLFWRRRRLPPGPFPWPLVGNLLHIGKEPPGTQALEQWRREYGDVFTYWLGGTPFVALCNFDTIQEVLVSNGESCTDREFFDDFYRMIRGAKDGIFNLNGSAWREHSNFIYRSFKRADVGKEAFENGVLGELDWLFESVNEELAKGSGFVENLTQNVDVFVGSTVNLWLLGYTFGGNRSDEFLAIKRSVVEFMAYSGEPLPSLVRCCPKIFGPLPYFRDAVKEIRLRIEAMHAYFEKQIKGLADGQLDLAKNEEEFADVSYVSSFLKESEKRDGAESFDADTLIGILRDFWIAGQDTVTNTIEWGLIFMILNQDKQAKLHEELDSVVGEERMIRAAERTQLPYLMATINEIQRLANLVPFNIPRKLTKPVTVHGYALEAGTAINACISLLFYDEKIFPEPHKFKPERFLTPDSQLKQIDEFIPFSVGRRLCLGRDLAKIELFLFFANFMNRYQVLPSRYHPLPSLKRNFGISVKAEQFHCNLVRRY